MSAICRHVHRVLGDSVQNMKFVLVTCLGIFTVGETWANGLTIQFQGIRDNTILEDETVGLELRSPRMITSGEMPDLSALEQDFFVGSRQTSHERVSINGQTSQSSKLTVQLSPKRIGDLKIPVLSWGGFESEQLILRVLPLSESERKARSELAFMEYDIDPNENAYVNSAIYVERRFYYQPGVQLVSYMPDFPDLKNAIVVTIRQPSNTSVIRNGIRYNLLNDRHAVFPEKSGVLELPSQRIVLSAWRQSAANRRVVTVNTDAQQINVRSIPLSYPYGESWFPASELSLESEFEPSNSNSVMVGEAVRWTVHVNARDAYSESFPELRLKIPDQIKAFTDKPQIENSVCEDDLCGTATLSTTLVPSKVGTWNFPAQRVTWWNTKLDKVEQAVIPSFHLIVVPNPSLASNLVQDPTIENPVGPSYSSSTVNEPVTNVPRGLSVSSATSDFWQFAAIVSTSVAVLLAGALFYTILIRRRDEPPKTSAGPELSSNLPRLRGLSPVQIKNAILTWLQAQYATSKVEAMKILQRTEVGNQLLSDINRATYTESGSSIEIDISEVQELLKSLRPDSKSQNTEIVPGFT